MNFESHEEGFVLQTNFVAVQNAQTLVFDDLI